MDSLEDLATFFGWCTVINIGIIILFFIFMVSANRFAGDLFARFFGISSKEAKATLFRVFQQYRLLIAVFNLVPYIALKIMV